MSVLRRDHFPELDCRFFDIVMPVLAGPALHGQNGAPMNVFKVAARKFVSRFGIFGMPFVDSQMPFCVFFKTMHANELVLFFWRRSVFPPRTVAVHDDVPFHDKLLRVLERIYVELHAFNLLWLVSLRGRSGVKDCEHYWQNGVRHFSRFYFHPEGEH